MAKYTKKMILIKKLFAICFAESFFV